MNYDYDTYNAQDTKLVRYFLVCMDDFRWKQWYMAIG